jgi:hypothetical protein
LSRGKIFHSVHVESAQRVGAQAPGPASNGSFTFQELAQMSFLDAIYIRSAVMFGQGEPENQPVVRLGFCKLVMPRQKAA